VREAGVVESVFREDLSRRAGDVRRIAPDEVLAELKKPAAPKSKKKA